MKKLLTKYHRIRAGLDALKYDYDNPKWKKLFAEREQVEKEIKDLIRSTIVAWCAKQGVAIDVRMEMDFPYGNGKLGIGMLSVYNDFGTSYLDGKPHWTNKIGIDRQGKFISYKVRTDPKLIQPFGDKLRDFVLECYTKWDIKR